MVDEVRVLRLLRAISDDLAVLKREATADSARRAQHEVLPACLVGRMRQARRFRNVLVHEYVDVDDGVVLVRLEDLHDLEDYVRAVARTLDAT